MLSPWCKERTMVSNLEIEIQGYKDRLDFQIMNMDRADVVLGREWLWTLGPSLKKELSTELTGI